MKKTVGFEFAIDDLKAVKIAGKLFNQFYNRQGFFAAYSMPEYVLPRNLKSGTREHALFLTYAISIDYMTDAVKLWKKSRGAYELHSEMFTPKKILEVSPRTVEHLARARHSLNKMRDSRFPFQFFIFQVHRAHQ